MRIPAALFQFRLSTALALMIAVGVLLGLNVTGRYELFFSQETFCYGWPVPLIHYSSRWGGPRFIELKAWVIDILFASLFVGTCIGSSRNLGRIRRMKFSTACCVMIVSAGVAYANLRTSHSGHVFPESNWPLVIHTQERRGWPEVSYSRDTWGSVPYINWYPHHAATNLFIAILIVLTAGIVCEWVCIRILSKSLK